MITINFDERKNEGLCEWIYVSIKNQIQAGVLKPNEKLPSKRNLAEHLGVSVITVQNAYALLIDEGWIYSEEKKGFFVTEVKIVKAEKNNSIEKEKLKKTVETEEKNNISVADFTSNAISKEKFPFSVWVRLVRNVLSEQSDDLFKRQSVWGTKTLRKAIAEYLFAFRGMKVQEDQIVIGSGTENLYTMLVQFLGDENIFALENPGYKKVSKIIQLNNASFVPVDIDGEGLSVKKLRKTDAKLVHVSPAHHFPTGTIMSIKRRNELLEWAYEQEGRFIIEDEYDSEFRFTGKPLSTVYSFDNLEKVFYINTFSKSVSPSLRISYMIIPRHLVKNFEEKMGFYSCSVSALEQLTLAKFIQEGHFEAHISRMRNYYKNLKKEIIYQISNSFLSGISTVLDSDSGLHFLLRLKVQHTQEEVGQILKEKGINVSFLSDYYYGGEAEKNILVINYSGIDKNKLKEVFALFG